MPTRLRSPAKDKSRARSSDTRSRVAEIVGGLSVALAGSFVVINPRVKNPNTEHWERAFELFNLLL